MTKSISVLIRNLYDPNPEVRGRAAMDLGENVAVDAVSSLIKALLVDDEASVRSLCAEALGTIADPSSIRGLTNALNSEKDARVISAINWALDSISKKLGKTREEILVETTSRSVVIDRISKPVSESNIGSDVQKSTPIQSGCSVKGCSNQAISEFEISLKESVIIVTHLRQKHLAQIKK